MATLNPGRNPPTYSVSPKEKRERWMERLLPRRCMVCSTACILAGLALSLLMAAGILPLSLTLFFVSWALLAVGGTLVLALWGAY